MTHGWKIMRGLYRDSVSLMQISARVAELPGVHQASAVMATPANIELLVDAGLIEEEGEAGANDLLIAAEADDEAAHRSGDGSLRGVARRGAGASDG